MLILDACPRCQKPLAEKMATYCKSCGLPFKAEAVSAHQARQKADLDYFSAFAYPLRASGLTLLIIGTLFFGFVEMLPGAGLISLLAFGYLSAYYFKVVVETARGNLEPADFPDFTNLFDDILMPLARFIGVNLVCFLPAVATAYFCLGGLEGIGQFSQLIDESVAGLVGATILTGIVFLTGLAFWPLALLSVALNQSILGVHPGILLRLLNHLRGEYLLVLGVLILSIGLNLILSRMLGSLPIIGGLLTGFTGLYSSLVNFHVIGLIYYKNREKMGG